MPPVFEYKAKQKGKNTELTYRWKTDEQNFAMPLEVTSYFKYEYGNTTEQFIRVNATNEWQTVSIPNFDAKDFGVNTDKFYVKKKSAG